MRMNRFVAIYIVAIEASHDLCVCCIVTQSSFSFTRAFIRLETALLCSPPPSPPLLLLLLLCKPSRKCYLILCVKREKVSKKNNSRKRKNRIERLKHDKKPRKKEKFTYFQVL